MAEPTAHPGLAYGVIKAPITEKPLFRWKAVAAALEGIRPAYKDLGIPEGTAFVAIHFRAGVQTVRFDAGKYGPAMAEKIEPLEGKGANFIIHASVPTFTNEAAAESLHTVLNSLYGAQIDMQKSTYFDVGTIMSIHSEYRGKFGEADVLGIFHLDDAGKPVCNLQRAILEDGNLMRQSVFDRMWEIPRPPPRDPLERYRGACMIIPKNSSSCVFLRIRTLDTVLDVAAITKLAEKMSVKVEPENETKLLISNDASGIKLMVSFSPDRENLPSFYSVEARDALSSRLDDARWVVLHYAREIFDMKEKPQINDAVSLEFETALTQAIQAGHH